ncbi:MAG: hypothetical protein B7Z55_17250 [Planctomycetales bacterium 12-60-4]|nr:MAG: hypothetical protein B7Z55_17250 [Planctomycetales bacterium 12-60-4]
MDPFGNQESHGLVPEPIALEPTTTSDSATRLASSSTVKPISPTEPNSQTAETRHVVERGDTLSSIASRYLGSATRFQEIYDANRDRLRDANDLRIGQELRIPPRVKRPMETTEPITNSPTSNLDSDADSTPSRFLPYPGPRAASKVTSPAIGSGGRRLSQVPPDDQVIRR